MRPIRQTVSRAVDVLLAADLPVIVAGRELGRYGGADRPCARSPSFWARRCTRISMPATAPSTFPTRHAHYGGYFAEDEHFIKGFDVFWSAGGSMFTIMAEPAAPLVPRGARVIHTSVDGMEIGRNYPVDVPMPANIAVAAPAMLEEMQAAPDARDGARRAAASNRPTSSPPGAQQLDERARAAWAQRPISNERLSREIDRHSMTMRS